MVVLGSFVPSNITPAVAEVTVIQEGNTPLTTEKTVQYPLEGYTITQGYTFFHPAVDLAAPKGTDVFPVKNGVVEDVSYSRFDYGLAVLVNHGNDTTSLYAHLSRISVAKGDKVTTLDTIGKSGSTGHSTGPHLHLEVRIHGLPVNPFVILPSVRSPIY